MNNVIRTTINGHLIRRAGIYSVCGDKHDSSEINVVRSTML